MNTFRAIIIIQFAAYLFSILENMCPLYAYDS